MRTRSFDSLCAFGDVSGALGGLEDANRCSFGFVLRWLRCVCASGENGRCDCCYM